MCFRWGHISHRWNKTVQLLQMWELTYLKHLEKLSELCQGHMKYAYTGCLHFVSAKQRLRLIPPNNLEH